MRSLNAKRPELSNMLRHADALSLSRGARQRLHWFLYALAHEGNVSLACRYFGISRDTFVRWAKRFNPRDPSTLEEQSRRPHTVRKPNTDAAVIALIRQYREQSPAMGKEQIAVLLHIDHRIVLSASTVGRIIARHRFFFGDKNSHRSKRIGPDFSGIDVSLSSSKPITPSSNNEEGETGAFSIPTSPLLGS